MQKQIQKSIHECFSRNQKISSKQTQSRPRSCRTFKTPSFADAVPLSDTEQFLFQNLRSFYRRECEEEMTIIGRAASSQSRSTAFTDTSRCKSSTLVMNKARYSSAPAAEEAKEVAADDLITILTCSRNPYDNFRRSMQEMVEARLECRGEVDRKFMEELLFHYLDLNNKKYYGCIVRAFLDLIVVSREHSGRRRLPWNSGCGGGRRKLKLEIKCMRTFGHK